MYMYLVNATRQPPKITQSDWFSIWGHWVTSSIKSAILFRCGALMWRVYRNTSSPQAP